MLILAALFVCSPEARSADAPIAAAVESPADDGAPEWDIAAAFGPTHDIRIDTQEGTWMSVSVHGDRLIFDLLGDVWTLPIAGGQATRLTSGAAWDSEPRFSPDGTRIAYVSDADGNEQIWTMNADGTNRTPLTSETTARVTDPVWDPNGPWILARRRTIDTRSIGVTEVWQYHPDGGNGVALTSKDDHPHAGEIATDGRRIWFSSRSGRFDYNDDPLRGLWRVMRLDRSTGTLRTEVSGNGSAVRPVLVPDGSGLVFVSRDRNKTLLEHLDFETRTRRVIADWLDHDQMEGFALHGVYPAMDWTDDGDLVLWAGGKLWRLKLDGTRIEIPFRVNETWRIHDVQRTPHAPSDTIQAKVNRWASANRFGDLAYSAMGRLVVQRGETVRDLGPGFAPRWSPDGRRLAWTSWSDEDRTGRLHVTENRGFGRTADLPIRGQLTNPVFSPDGRTIAVLRDPNQDNRPNLGSYPWFELVRLDRIGASWSATILDETVDAGVGFRAPRLSIHNGRIWWLAVGERKSRTPAKSDFVSVNLDGHDRLTHITFPGAVEAMPSPDFSRIAYKLQHQAWVAALPMPGVHAQLDDLPKHRLTETVGDWINWTPDGTAVTWVQGDRFHTRSLPAHRIPHADDPMPSAATSERILNYRRPRHRPTKRWAISGATVLTMDDAGAVENATVVINGDTIESIEADGAVPPGVTAMDATGKTIIPGLIDVHAHMHYGARDILPEHPWQYGVNLDFGVTTVHDPSASTDLVFTQAERVAAGLTKGPRVFSTGFVLYGALGNNNAETPDREAAIHHVRRLKAVGATSVKVYQQSRRDQRQWFVEACADQDMLCIAEGGGDLWMNMSMLADGFQAIEHSLPNAPVYDDVHQFMAGSATDGRAGTAYSPTLLVAYGGLSGDHFFHQHHGAYDNPRLMRHWDRRDLDAKTRRGRLTAPDGDWNHQAVARDAATMARNGVLVTLGAHGEVQGLGVHWELWALAGPGAMTPMEALQAATINGARYLGVDAHVGSIRPGKLADLVILDRDPRKDIRHSTSIHTVIKNGEAVSVPER
ncbi:MAG: amidohydrolase family protein [Myxococcota bacterium]|nr:amidohydrolase family protein [Myxococcota bacterium]